MQKNNSALSKYKIMNINTNIITMNTNTLTDNNNNNSYKANFDINENNTLLFP